MLGPVILAASRSDRMRRLISAAPVTKQVVDRFIPGESVDDVVPIIEDLTGRGLELTMDVVGEDITTPEQAAAARDAYLTLIDRLSDLGLGERVEMSVKLSMFGQALDGGHELALANVRPVVEAAAAIGTTVTLDAEDHTTLDSMFAIHEELRKDFPQTGCVIQAYLFRTEADARRLAEAGSRVRLVKGAYKEPKTIAFQAKADVDAAFVRIMKLLLKDGVYPAIATHDPAMIAATKAYAAEIGLPRDGFEFQLLYGVRRDLQAALVAEGYRVRIYIPFGREWFPYFMRRLGERPANALFVLKSILRER